MLIFLISFEYFSIVSGGKSVGVREFLYDVDDGRR